MAKEENAATSAPSFQIADMNHSSTTQSPSAAASSNTANDSTSVQRKMIKDRCRLSAPSSFSPIRTVDPLVRTLNTVMYGLLVHFGTLWMIDDDTDSSQGRLESTADYDCALQSDEVKNFPAQSLTLPYIPWILFLHEYWVYLQHSNVLGNPFCQRLDRQYGIALLRSNQHVYKHSFEINMTT